MTGNFLTRFRSSAWWLRNGSAVAVVLFLLAAAMTIWNFAATGADRVRISAQTNAALSLERLLSLARDIETGGRGFALVGSDSYLEPYRNSVAGVERLETDVTNLWLQSGGDESELQPIFSQFAQKRAYTERLITARRDGGLDAAIAVAQTGEGKALMDGLREQVGALQAESEERRVHIAARDRLRSGVLTALSLASALLACATFAWLAWHRRRLVQRSERELSAVGDRFRTLADNIPQLAWMADTKGTLYWYNKRWYDYTGTTPADMENDGWKKVHDPEYLEAAAQRFADAIANGDPWQDTFPLRGKDGSYRWFLSMAQPIRDDQGRILRWFGTNTDVTEQREQELELAAARDAAEDANRAKSQFLANMSHELRTPLSAVIGYSEMLEEEVEEMGEKHLLGDLGKIKSNARHLLSLINDVLDISKIEANKVEIYAEEFDVAEMVREVAATVDALVSHKSNRLELSLGANLGRAHTDVVKIRQVLINLLSNAAKFTENGLITLTVERKASDQGDRITFRVKDTGLGMSEEQLARLFQRFTQADASTTRRFGGTGLGLAITKAFTDMLGGEVSVESQPDLGSTFTVSIPPELGKPRVVDSETEIKPVESEEDLVLVIDDDASTRDLLSRFLGREGFTVREAGDGKTGLALAEALKPKVILLDVTMPRMDGWEVLRNLKSDPHLSAIPVVMCTVIDEKHLGFSLGAADYLVKPVDWDHLKEVMERIGPQTPVGDVLIVEDDTDTRARLEKIMSREGWTVTEAEHGRDALAKVALHTPSLVLLDLNMPEMDGFTFLREFRSKPDAANVPVVVMTARDLSAAERAELKGNAARVIEKGTLGLGELAAQLRTYASPRDGADAKAPEKVS
ncbi:response regulator [Mesorhizobium sp. RP14(2022)]|uniref:histidine kinase n=1 Tax=Mesorhizobium liriopis TaxID=2953882 RepID=A0ABT1C402_9HYPH|nr:response regulator [Mesorhizobium liriopis]MCO6049378.1 response regulator [Mesorhizobium liriopis]